jgi:hypothetical protein
MDQRTTAGIDLAKEIFAVCVLNSAGAVIERQRLRRAAFERWLVSLPNRAASPWKPAAPRITGVACSQHAVTPCD